MQVPKGTSNIRRLFASPDIIITVYTWTSEMQKQNETKWRNFKHKLLAQSFSGFLEKQTMGIFSGINFKYIYSLHLVPIIRIYFDRNLIYPKVQAARIPVKKKLSSHVPNLLHMFNIKHYTRNNIQWNLSKADNIGAKKSVRFRQMSAL